MPNSDDTRKITPLEKRGPYSEAAGELIAVCMEIAAMRRFPVQPSGDDFLVQEQVLLRLARASDKVASAIVEETEINSPCHFPLAASAMTDALRDNDVFAAFREAAKECDDNNEAGGPSIFRAPITVDRVI